MGFSDFLLYLHYGASSCCKTIFDDLTLSDIQSLRLTAKTVDSVASAYYFPFSRIYISAHPADIKVFREVTGNPHLASQVEEIVWDDTAFSRSLLDFNIYKLLWARQPMVFERELKRYHDVYARMVRDNLALRDAQSDFEALVQALPGLPRLKRIALTRLSFEDRDDPKFGGMKGRSSPAAKQWRESSQTLRTFMIEPDVHWIWPEWQCFRNDRSVAMQDIFDPTYALEPLDPSLLMGPEPVQAYFADEWGDAWTMFQNLSIRSGGPAPVYAPFRGLVLLTRALRQTRTRIQEFRIVNLYDNTEGLPIQYFSDCNPELPSLLAVLESVKHLSLDIDFDTKFGPELEKGACRDVFATSLGTAQALRTLNLKIHDRHWRKFIGFLRSNPMQSRLPYLWEVTIASGSKCTTGRKLASAFTADDLADLLRWCRSLVEGNADQEPTDDSGDTSRPRLPCLRLENILLAPTSLFTMHGDLQIHTWKSVLANLETICSSHHSEGTRKPVPVSHWVHRLELCDVVDKTDDITDESVSVWSSSENSIMDYLDGQAVDPLHRVTR
jgi:hypothetical protein